jgi:hypothetical protein
MGLFCTTATTVDLFAITAATGSNPSSALISANATGSTADVSVTGGVAASGSGNFRLTGIVANGATAGTVKFRWAQNASNAAGVNVNVGSTLIATRIP